MDERLGVQVGGLLGTGLCEEFEFELGGFFWRLGVWVRGFWGDWGVLSGVFEGVFSGVLFLGPYIGSTSMAMLLFVILFIKDLLFIIHRYDVLFSSSPGSIII